MRAAILGTVVAALLLVCAGMVLAQASPEQDTAKAVSDLNAKMAEAGAATATGCAACGTALVVIAIAVVVINVVLLVWVAKDAKNRGMDNSVVWVILVVLTGLIGLIVYIFSRPKGELVPCAQCHNKRLQASAKCPHCGNA